jgi:hypothetical protein
MSSTTDGSRPRSDDGSDASGGGGRSLRPDNRVVLVHRVAALAVALVIGVFGVLGIIGGLGFFDTGGADVLGLSSNGLLSTVSIVTALVLVAAAVRGGRVASTTMLVIGVLFLVSAFANLALLETSLNLLAFRLPNVFFSIGAGLVLLVLGAYGRVSSRLPDDNPYSMDRRAGRAERAARDGGDGGDGGGSDGDGGDRDADGPDGHALDTADQPRPHSNAEHVADVEMADAARAIASGTASDEQRRRTEAMSSLRTQEDRRSAWMAADG